ncbi:ABC transporter ATP-binding protein [Candidimonas nitroreducens]|uniref:Sugar ABC transporter n=1 Tax=Candidimonas nitroreducens TaxID=683354 RepID=A0A225LXP4_9BURK|nr:ABC transporter ATP-binding protein [Candidimonas nitroreducens]OWT53984.1 sugar ABC transporter [Candidimonas nitroreducens]
MKSTQEEQDAIRICKLGKSFGDYDAIKDVNISVPKGAFLVLVGPSGCGKSTLLRLLAGLESPTEGEIALDGRVVSSGASGIAVEPGARKAGLVFQSYALWPHMTVAGNISWPLKVAKWPKQVRDSRVDEVLSLLGIGNLADRFPAEISGGQQQRVAIARTIAPKPSILLFDEPLSNLDAKLRVEMRSELMRIHRATGATSVYVTHDQVEAMTMASHVIVLNNGKVEQSASPYELLENPRTTFVASFIGTPPANILPADRIGDSLVFDDTPLAPASFARGRDKVQLLYRAQDVAIGAVEGRPQLAGTFMEAAPIDASSMVSVLVGNIRVTAMSQGYFKAVPGDVLTLSLASRPGGVFSAHGERID